MNGTPSFADPANLEPKRDETIELPENGTSLEVLPDLPSFIGRVCSGYAPVWGELQTPLV
jgi:hypothetical protein